MVIRSKQESAAPELRRVLTFWPLVLYGLGVIVGAGIYVALGTVIARAGAAAPFSFIVAGAAAALTGLSCAELASRFPDAAGSAAYVEFGFESRRIGAITGLAVTSAVAVATASIARGAIYYLRELAPLPDAVLTTGLIVALTAVAISGVRLAVGFGAAVAVIEIGGLIAAVIAGILAAAPQIHFVGMLPVTFRQMRGAIAGSFVAFFAFIGFETLANMAEEVTDPTHTVPRGILAAVAVSVVLYVAVAFAAVLGDSGGSNALLGLFTGRAATIFAVAAFLAVANGVVVQIAMLARLFYGMARHRQLPGLFTRLNSLTRTPINASLAAGAIVLSAAITLPFERLLVIANALTLVVFVLVNLSLWRIHRRTSDTTTFADPAWAPPAPWLSRY